MSRIRRSLVAALAGLAAASAPLDAQVGDEPAWQELRDAVTNEWLTLGMLIQTVLDPAVDPDDGAPASVRLPNTRILLSGQLDEGFGYFIQTNFAGGPTILDARVEWAMAPGVALWAGRFKTPFSREVLTYAGTLDFVNRSQAVNALAPNRQMGIQIAGDAGETARWSLGGFSGPDNTPANESLLGVARFEIAPPMADEDRVLSIAASVAVGRDEALAGRSLGAGFDGNGSLFGIDARMTSGPLLLAAEGIAADFDPEGSASVDASGLYATAGYMVREDTQLLIRWDRYSPPGGSASDALVLGANVWPTAAAKLQVNWFAPFADGAVHKAYALLQIGF